MKKTYILLFLLILAGCSKKKSTYKVEDSLKDSLINYFDLANDQTVSTSRRFQITQRAYNIVMNQENDSIHRVNLIRIANRFYNLNKLLDYEKTVRTLINNSKQADDTLCLAKAYSYLGDYYGEIIKPDSAYTFYFKAEKLFLTSNDFYNLGRTRYNKAFLQYNLSDYLGSEIAVFNALRAVKGKDGKDLIFDCYNLLGILYNDLGEFAKAIEYNAKAYAIIDDDINSSILQPRAMSLNNMGLVYQTMKNNEKAIVYFEKGLSQENLLINQPSVYAMLLDNLAYSKFKIGQTKGVMRLFEEALKIRNKLNVKTGIIINKVHLSEFYAFEKDTVTAISLGLDALETAKKSNNNRYELVPLKQLALLQPKKAGAYTSEYLRINDSLQKAERSMGNKFTRIEYETDKIKGEYSTLELKNRNLIYLFGFFIIIALFLYIVKSQGTKHKVLLYKQQQQQANEYIYNLIINQQNMIDTSRVMEKKRVAQELHDGVLGRMFGVRMNLEGLNSFNDDLAISQRKEYIIELKKVEQDIREISHEMNREKSELINNFVAIVDNLFEEQRKTFPTKLITKIDRTIHWDDLTNLIKVNLFRIIQESLQNCNKYANAKTIKIELLKINGNISLEIADDGAGFNTKMKKKGIGLQNMISRAKECQGELYVMSNKNIGTKITVIIPLEQKQIPH
ncbi:tetratricopeptide repeat-containing sensor histidine kinase [Flavobacterium sp. 7A]|uniref:tetratricopeptide repeat-containing sensor histidine kinase n=1 Tax=Flavobacterium sp. 7A TaxID=2940571 RepID=UPI002226B0FB|nr:tetratricopeptide repeat-containing sensor histidine kinase [Flavobacterium sp. 7A]MCW2118331.1 signal transduction histidine kinase [Flavobacterium sp. 7A]